MSDNEQAIGSDIAAQTLADLEKTIEFLRANRWTQGGDILFDYGKDTAPMFCLNGAIMAAVGGLTWNVEDKSYKNTDVYGSRTQVRAIRVRQAIRADLPPRYSENLISFNDTPDRTKQEVIDQVTQTWVRLSQGGTDA